MKRLFIDILAKTRKRKSQSWRQSRCPTYPSIGRNVYINIILLCYISKFTNFSYIVFKDKKVLILSKSKKRGKSKKRRHILKKKPAEVDADKISHDDDYEDDGGDNKPIRKKKDIKVEYIYREILVNTCSLFKF